MEQPSLVPNDTYTLDTIPYVTLRDFNFPASCVYLNRAVTKYKSDPNGDAWIWDVASLLNETFPGVLLDAKLSDIRAWYDHSAILNWGLRDIQYGVRDACLPQDFQAAGIQEDSDLVGIGV